MGSFQRLAAALLWVSTAVSAGGHDDTQPSPWRFTYRSLSKRASSDFRLPPQQPPLWNYTAASLIGAAKSLINEYEATLDKITNTTSPTNATFANVILPLSQQESQSSLTVSILQFYQYVTTDASLRDASVEATSLLDSFDIESGMREDLFKLVDSVFQGQKTLAADMEADSQRLVTVTRRDYISNGLGIPAGPKRERYRALREQIAEQELQFNSIYNSQNESVWLAPEDFAGVPDDLVSTLERGSGQNQGKLRLVFKNPDSGLFMQYARNGAARQKVYIASANKEANKRCAALVKDTVVLRDEAARLLGYPNHAAFRLENRMAHNVSNVMPFLLDLKSRLKELGERELAQLVEAKKADFASRNLTFDGSVYAWDRSYYQRTVVEKQYSVDSAKIKEYFPIQHTIAEMLRIYEALFGFVFVELSADDKKRLSPTGKAGDLVWHDDVILFAVWDADDYAADGANPPPKGGFAGYLYMDLHPRPGKYGHAANFGLQPGFLPAGDGRGAPPPRRVPASALVCNLGKPTAGKPTVLLSHGEVETLFHELGHGIHDLSGRTRYSRFHGTRVVRDFVEAPSQMLENWVWTPATLRRITRHYRTGESMPDALIQQLIASKHAGDGVGNLHQVRYAEWDMLVHTPKTHEEIASLDVSKLYNDMLRAMSGVKSPEDVGFGSDWGYPVGEFIHPMSGYDAGVYSYLWSQVYSSDMFYTAFKANPMDTAVGRRYRRMVLEKGGSQDEALTLEQFLGRKPSSEAFYKELGL